MVTNIVCRVAIFETCWYVPFMWGGKTAISIKEHFLIDTGWSKTVQSQKPSVSSCESPLTIDWDMTWSCGKYFHYYSASIPFSRMSTSLILYKASATNVKWSQLPNSLSSVSGFLLNRVISASFFSFHTFFTWAAPQNWRTSLVCLKRKTVSNLTPKYNLGRRYLTIAVRCISEIKHCIQKTSLSRLPKESMFNLSKHICSTIWV